MVDSNDRIKRIVKMEEKILACERCSPLKACSVKPSLGKGDLNPHIMVVFPAENEFTTDRSNLAQFKEQLKERFGSDVKVYYSYIVRCQPKLCRLKKEREYLVNGKYVSASSSCILSGGSCEGQFVQPSDEESLCCIHYLVEEIDILQPRVIITMGEKSSNIIFKSFGIFAPLEKSWDDTANRLYEAKGYRFLPYARVPNHDLAELFTTISQFELERFFE
ncbi:MAG: hypothetical protein ACM3O9_05270 [Methylocystaceae bacterium]